MGVCVYVLCVCGCVCGCVVLVDQVDTLEHSRKPILYSLIWVLCFETLDVLYD